MKQDEDGYSEERDGPLITAGELRAIGYAVPEGIPDVAHVPRSALQFNEPQLFVTRNGYEVGLPTVTIRKPFRIPEGEATPGYH